MKIVKDDIWKLWDASPVSIICIPTNGCVRPTGQLIMGKGMALDAAMKFHSLPTELGRLVRETGNIPHLVLVQNGTKNRLLCSFPTKRGFVETKGGRVPGWKLPSEMTLIKDSAIRLLRIANTTMAQDIYLPAVGCGLGGLEWKEVKALLETIFDDRFTVCLR